MTSLSCCLDFHDDLMYGLGFMDHVELFGVKKSQFKKANVVEVKKNKIHMKKWMMKYTKTWEIRIKEDQEYIFRRWDEDLDLMMIVCG